VGHTTILWLASELLPDVERTIGELKGFEVQLISGLEELVARAAVLESGGIIVSLPVGGASSAEVLDSIRKANGDIPVIVHDGGLRPEAVAQVVRALVECGVSTQIGELASRVAADAVREPWRKTLIGESPAMQSVIERISMIAPRRSTVLITGETGTGKEVVARAIHMASDRAARPMVAVNCSALPETLMEAELFGYVKGAFTGAVGARAGRFEQSHLSTIFLDEIGDLQLEIQGKLLRVLQEHELQRVGSSETITVDTRVIAATNVDLSDAVRNKRFREDLLYRLQVVPIHIPPLRERVEDISLLVQHFIDKLCRKEDLPLRHVTPAAMEHLCTYSWPGNVRQLEHAVEVAIVLSGERRVLGPRDFPCSEQRERTAPSAAIEVPDEGLDFEAVISQFQRYLLQQALEKTGGNKSRAAEMLRMKRSTLVSKVKTLAGDGPALFANAGD
jgi:transcriptional regulator with GAF, ATPase, and Fis domain